MPTTSHETAAAPSAGPVLVAGERRLFVWVRLAVWLAVVSTYYLALLSQQIDFVEDWFLLLMPLLLVPYLVDLVRGIAAGAPLVIDGRTRTLRAGRRTLATFAQIRAVELSTVNGRCEELSLRALLDDGSDIAIERGGAAARVDALARRIGAMLQIEVRRAG